MYNVFFAGSDDLEIVFAAMLAMLHVEKRTVRSMEERLTDLRQKMNSRGFCDAPREHQEIARLLSDLAAVTLAMTEAQDVEELRLKRDALEGLEVGHASHGLLSDMIATALMVEEARFVTHAALQMH